MYQDFDQPLNVHLMLKWCGKHSLIRKSMRLLLFAHCFGLIPPFPPQTRVDCRLPIVDAGSLCGFGYSDGNKQIIIPSFKRDLNILDHDGHSLPGWPIGVKDGFFHASPVITQSLSVDLLSHLKCSWCPFVAYRLC
jgi:hypothetical protein